MPKPVCSCLHGCTGLKACLPACRCHCALLGLQDVFSPGERISALLLTSEQGGRRLALSTAHLEVAAGDMLRDKAAVFATAVQQAALVQQQMGRAPRTAAPQQAVVATPQQQEQQAVPLAAEAAVAPAHHSDPGDALSAVLGLAPPSQLADEAAAQQQQQQKGAAAPRRALAGAAASAPVSEPSGMSGYLPGARLGVVMAAAVWQGSGEEDEQGWWCEGPLAWRAADEREQWRAEQQLVREAATAAAAMAGAAQQQQLPSTAAADEAEADGEMLWLQPPAQLDPAV